MPKPGMYFQSADEAWDWLDFDASDEECERMFYAENDRFEEWRRWRDRARHGHKWQPAGSTTNGRMSPSPCSTWDDHLWDEIVQIQSCECGAMRYLTIGFKNRRRRGDDLRARDGNGPLGTPLQRSGTYAKPRVRVVEAKSIYA